MVVTDKLYFIFQKKEKSFFPSEMYDKQYKAPINFSWIFSTLEICSTFLIFKFSLNFFHLPAIPVSFHKLKRYI